MRLARVCVDRTPTSMIRSPLQAQHKLFWFEKWILCGRPNCYYNEVANSKQHIEVSELLQQGQARTCTPNTRHCSASGCSLIQRWKRAEVELPNAVSTTALSPHSSEWRATPLPHPTSATRQPPYPRFPIQPPSFPHQGHHS